jgi:YaiO family outer membrane protein
MITRIERSLSSAGIATLAAVALLVPFTGSAQEPTPPWFGGVFYDVDTYSGSVPGWTTWTGVRVLAQRRIDRATLGLEVASLRRFDLSDQAVSGEIYLELWEGAYTHLRGRVTQDGDFLPKSDVRGELFQSLGGGWEASANLWTMNVTGPNVLIGGIGLAKYQGIWFIRSEGNLARLDGEDALSGRLYVRRYVGASSREYIEVGAGAGKEIAILGAGPLLDARSTWFISGNHHRFLSEHLGYSITVGVTDFEDVPLRRSLSLGLITRF